ncbi:hypothetical protein FB451DRAFT_716909 [Mycena latifolia]|nr:hypothetical protein FB451DRAFT_716909 [Mycena latifolia]
MVEAAIADGTRVPPAPRVKVDLRTKPQLWDAYLTPPVVPGVRGEKDNWEAIMVGFASISFSSFLGPPCRLFLPPFPSTPLADADSPYLSSPSIAPRSAYHIPAMRRFSSFIAPTAHPFRLPSYIIPISLLPALSCHAMPSYIPIFLTLCIRSFIHPFNRPSVEVARHLPLHLSHVHPRVLGLGRGHVPVLFRPRPPATITTITTCPLSSRLARARVAPPTAARAASIFALRVPVH